MSQADHSFYITNKMSLSIDISEVLHWSANFFMPIVAKTFIKDMQVITHLHRLFKSEWVVEECEINFVPTYHES